MKSIASILVALVAIVVLTTSCNAQKQFADIASNKDVTSVYISKAMLKMAGVVDGEYSDGIDIGAILNDLNSIEILTCEEADAIKKVVADVEKRIAELQGDVLVESNDGEETVVIYGTPNPKDENKISNLIIYSREPGELSLVVLNGSIDMATVAGMIE